MFAGGVFFMTSKMSGTKYHGKVRPQKAHGRSDRLGKITEGCPEHLKSMSEYQKDLPVSNKSIL